MVPHWCAPGRAWRRREPLARATSLSSRTPPYLIPSRHSRRMRASGRSRALTVARPTVTGCRPPGSASVRPQPLASSTQSSISLLPARRGWGRLPCHVGWCGHIDLPCRAPGLLVELALHQPEDLGQPSIARILCAKDQGQACSVSVRASKPISPAIQADPSSIPGLDEADRIHRAEVQPIGDRLTLAHKGVDAGACPERPVKGPVDAIARRYAITTSDVLAFAPLGGNHCIRLGLRPVLEDSREH